VLPQINEKKDSIGANVFKFLEYMFRLSPLRILVFQQIDVEDSLDRSNGGVSLRMFGVTKVHRLHIDATFV
jgi:hypothetical protein